MRVFLVLVEAVHSFIMFSFVRSSSLVSMSPVAILLVSGLLAWFGLGIPFVGDGVLRIRGVYSCSLCGCGIGRAFCWTWWLRLVWCGVCALLLIDVFEGCELR